jgi:iron(III) transport system permease protein
MGWGAAVALAALAVLAAFGLARRGLFRGDLFVSAAVVVSGALLALFIVFPVLKALSAAVFTEEGQASAGLWERSTPATSAWAAWPAASAAAWPGTPCCWP